jgi:hypothetical protein
MASFIGMRRFYRDAPLGDRRVLLHDFPHARLYARQVVGCERFPILHRAKETPSRQRVIYDDLGAMKKLPDSRHQQKGEGALIDARSVAGSHGNRHQFGIGSQGIRQLAQPVVDQRSHNRRGLVQNTVSQRTFDKCFDRSTDGCFIDRATWKTSLYGLPGAGRRRLEQRVTYCFFCHRSHFLSHLLLLAEGDV